MRAGIADIVMCQENEKRTSTEIPEGLPEGVTFHYVENVQDVWAFALTNEIVDHPLNFEIKDEEEKESK